MPRHPFPPPDRAPCPPGERPLARPSAERVTIFCSCGVEMQVSWATTEAVACFGCGRSFAPPPDVTTPPRQWRPELALPPAPAPRVATRVQLVATAAAIFLTLALLLALGFGIVAP